MSLTKNNEVVLKLVNERIDEIEDELSELGDVFGCTVCGNMSATDMDEYNQRNTLNVELAQLLSVQEKLVKEDALS